MLQSVLSVAPSNAKPPALEDVPADHPTDKQLYMDLVADARNYSHGDLVERRLQLNVAIMEKKAVDCVLKERLGNGGGQCFNVSDPEMCARYNCKPHRIVYNTTSTPKPLNSQDLASLLEVFFALKELGPAENVKQMAAESARYVWGNRTRKSVQTLTIVKGLATVD